MRRGEVRRGRTPWVGVAIGVLLLARLAGCGGDVDWDDSTSAQPYPSASTSALPTEAEEPSEPAEESSDPAEEPNEGAGGPAHLGDPAGSGTVIRVVDGDTVEVTASGGGTVDVRVLGIDTPETKHPKTGVQCWGPEATRYAERTLLDKRVRLYTDPTQDVRDRYGRLLAYVVLGNGANYSIEAARSGNARAYVYDRPVTLYPQVLAAEDQARAAKRGLWGPPCNGATTVSTPQPPPAGSGLDPQFATCREAKAHGYGPYHQGSDPEYGWYSDRDRDGMVCE